MRPSRVTSAARGAAGAAGPDDTVLAEARIALSPFGEPLQDQATGWVLNLVLGVLHLALGARADRDDAAGARRHGDAESVPQEGAAAVAEGAVEAPGRPEPEDAEPPAAVDPAAVAPDLPATDDQDRALAHRRRCRRRCPGGESWRRPACRNGDRGCRPA